MLKGFCSYWIRPTGHHFLSDAYPTLEEVKEDYTGAEITGYIDLSAIPASAYVPLTEETT